MRFVLNQGESGLNLALEASVRLASYRATNCNRRLVLATRTKRYYRDESLFEELARGSAVFSTLRTEGYAKTLRLFVLIVLSVLVWTLALLMVRNSGSGAGETIGVWAVIGFALTLTLLTALRVGQRLTWLAQRLFHRPVAFHIDLDGIHQSGPQKAAVDLTWADIRLIQHKGASHLIRGVDKRQKVEISTQLEGHETASSFLKFVFLLRQEIGDNWRGLLTEVEARLEGPGFHFHYDRDRTNTVFINSQGIRHSSADGIESDMPWDLLRESVVDVQKDQLRFRHKGSRTSIAIPRGTDSDDVIEELIRWALHVAPDFSHTSA